MNKKVAIYTSLTFLSIWFDAWMIDNVTPAYLFAAIATAVYGSVLLAVLAITSMHGGQQ